MFAFSTFRLGKKRLTRKQIAEKAGDHTLVDLRLDSRLKPAALAEFEKSGKPPLSVESLVNSLSLSSSEYAIGSAKAGVKVHYRHGDLGLFGAVFEAWKNHWVLRTSPDDWWFPVACRIAKAIDAAARGSHSAQKVRDMFVAHEGKQNVSVELPVHTIFEANYDQLFASFSSGIEQRIKAPEYAEVMRNDFGTSSSSHVIASQINLMASVQEFFEFEMMCCGCGLRGLEMEGSVADWERLSEKLERLHEILKPIEWECGIRDKWLDHVREVFRNLAMTRKKPKHRKVAKWWINCLCDTTGTKWVGGGGSSPGRPVEVEAYDGWLIPFLTDYDRILAENLGLGGGGSASLRKRLVGLNQVPMKVSLTWCGVGDESTLVAGMAGFRVFGGDGDDGKENGEVVPSVQPHHMWAMLLPRDSPLRGKGPGD